MAEARILEDVVGQMLSATTAQEISEARSVQREWLREHPEDRLTVLMAGEQLTMLERLAESPADEIQPEEDTDAS